MYIKILFVCLIVANVCTARTKSKDVIGFPEEEENQNIKNKENRKPVFLPAMCPENELYYPGDQKDDWICDCRPAYIFHPLTDKCWPAYQRGPCLEGQYLVLTPNSAIPVCQKNTCVIDNYVTYEGSCQLLGSSTPCAHLFPAAAAVGVNATDLTIGCVKLNFENRFSDSPEEPKRTCPPGCRRSVNGKCIPNSV